MTNEAPTLAAVIGWPIGHSRSPILHRYWLEKLGIAGYYIPVGLRPENFESAIRAMPKLGFKGANITIPYKETVLSLATSVSDRASLIGAANTIVFGNDGSIRADNTDGYGFLENIKQQTPDWKGSNGPAIVLGAGGASRAVVSALLSDGAPEVRISNRTKHRADMIKDQFGAKVKVVDWARVNEAFDGVATIVNTTSLGMVGNPELRVKLDAAPAYALVNDIVYTPIETDLLIQAKSHGLRTVDGVGMLLHQAVPGFESWFDHRPVVDDTVRNLVLNG